MVIAGMGSDTRDNSPFARGTALRRNRLDKRSDSAWFFPTGIRSIHKDWTLTRLVKEFYNGSGKLPGISFGELGSGTRSFG